MLFKLNHNLGGAYPNEGGGGSLPLIYIGSLEGGVAGECFTPYVEGGPCSFKPILSHLGSFELIFELKLI